MAELDPIVIAVNGTLLVLAIILSIILTRAASLHTYNIGNDPVQWQLKLRMMKVIIGLITIALAAAIFNLYFGA
jgi:hypothetical protein